MTQSEIREWIWLAILYSGFSFWAFFQIRYLIRRYRRSRWPAVEAVIQKGAVGRVPAGKGATIPASFMGYAYIVEGVRYAGFFALIGDETGVQHLYSTLGDSQIQIRYNPSDPNVSFLGNYKDPRFDGLRATQSPEMLNHAPAFDLQDAIRGATARR